MEHEGAEKGQRDGNAPHADGQAVHIEEGVAAAVQDAVDRHGVHAAADHVDGHDDHHAGQVVPCGIGQDDHAHDERRDRQDQSHGGESDDEGEVSELDAVSFSEFQLACAQGVADDDAGGAADPVAGAADEVTDHRGHRIGSGSIDAHVAHDCRVGGESDAPEQGTAHQREALLPEVARQPALSPQQFRPERTDIVSACADAYAQGQFDDAGDGRGQGRPARLHPGRSEEAVDEDGVEQDVQDHRARADIRAGLHVIRHLHDGQAALREAGQQVGPSGDAQVGASYCDQLLTAREDAHQHPRHHLARHEKKQGQDPRTSEHQAEQALQRLSVSFAPVLGAEDRSGGCDRHEEHILNELDLGCQGDGRHLLLRDAPEHQRVAGRHQCQHQALEDDGQGDLPQLVVEYFVVDLHFIKLSVKLWCSVRSRPLCLPGLSGASQ